MSSSSQSIDFSGRLGIHPYGEPPNHSTIVTLLLNVNEVISRVESFIYFPIQKIVELFSSQPQKKLIDRTIPINPLLVKTETETFDHQFHYILREGKIYFRPIYTDSNTPWKEIPFPKKAIRISADGDQLVALDERRQVYCAKTASIYSKLEWRKEWFNLNQVAAIINFFKPASLNAMEGARAIAISHKDIGSHLAIDTLYMLDPSGTRIFFADPQLPNKFHNEITLPEEGQFVAENMDASASTLFLISRAKNADGKESAKMYTRHADFDSIGRNQKNKTPLDRMLHGEDWFEQPSVNLSGNAHLTKRIAIVQTGKRQECCELRVEGTDSLGNTGYYVKKIYDRAWRFQRSGRLHRTERISLPRRITGIPKRTANCP